MTPEKDKWIAEHTDKLLTALAGGGVIDLRAALSEVWEKGREDEGWCAQEKEHRELALASYKAELAGRIKNMKRSRYFSNHTANQILTLLQPPPEEETKT